MEKVGVVLSGGGAKGAYQIGVWKALNKLKIKYDIVTGTSVGALNGLMFVQKEYRKAYKIWKNISYDFIFDEHEKLNVKADEIYKIYISEFFKHGGMEVKQLERQIELAYDEKKFYSSNVDYGIVVFNLSKLKPEMITKSKLTKENIKDYVLASACCFPTFKIKKIQGTNYIDGGYYDNMPINLCEELGATKVIAVDTKAIGIKRKVKNKDLQVITISPNNKIIPLLVFDKNLAIQTMKFGYNDTMKVFGKYMGKTFTYKINSFKKFERKYNIKISINEILKYYTLKKQQEIYKILSKPTLLDIAEYTGVSFNLVQEKIYSIKKFNKLLLKQLENTDSTKIDLKSIKYNDKKLIKNKEYIKFILEKICDKNETLIKEFISNTPKEFLSALYLYTIINN